MEEQIIHLIQHITMERESHYKTQQEKDMPLQDGIVTVSIKQR